jgi:hypothetical protein
LSVADPGAAVEAPEIPDAILDEIAVCSMVPATAFVMVALLKPCDHVMLALRKPPCEGQVVLFEGGQPGGNLLGVVLFPVWVDLLELSVDLLNGTVQGDFLARANVDFPLRLAPDKSFGQNELGPLGRLV